MSPSLRKAIATIRLVIIVVVILVIVLGGVVAYFALNTSSSTTTTLSSTLSTTTSSSASSQTSVSSSSSSLSSSSSVSSSIVSSSTSSSSSVSSTTSSTSSSSSTSNSSVGTLTYDSYFGSNSGGVSPLYLNNGLTWNYWLQYAVYQPLITINETAEFTSNVNQYLPGLALNWTVSADGTTYTFNLRQNVHFSNGDPFNAYQVWAEDYGFYYLASNSSSWMFGYPVFNMSAVKFGPATIQLLNQSGLIHPNSQALSIMQNSSWPIYATGPSQIVFHLSSPFIYFPGTQVVANGECYDVQYVLQHGGFGTATNVNPNFQQTPVPGTGPYVVTGVGPSESYVTMSQDPAYWAANWTAAQLNIIPIFDPGHAKNIVVNLVADDLARYTDLASGKVQMADIQSSDWNLVNNNPEYSYYKSPPLFGSIVFLGLGVLNYPTNITAVRRAISHAINFTDVSQKAYLGQLVPFVGPEYPTYGQFYNLGNLPPYQYNLTLAKQILANASIDTSKFPVFTMTTLTGCQGCINSAQVIQSDLAQIGITVNIQVQTPTQYYTAYGCVCPNLRPQLSMALGGNGYAPNLPTPADAWISFVNNATINWADYSNAVVQKCVNSFTQSNNATQILGLCTAAQKQIYNDVPYVWMGVLHPWLPAGGSMVWKTGVIKGFLVDPAFTGAAVGPILNTVTFG